jgi:hypothetical protein
MPHDAGVWLDHSGATIIRVDPARVTTVTTIPSNVEPRRHSRPHTPRSSTTHRALGGTKHEENRRREQIKAYYASLAKTLRGAARVLLIGPSVAKYELASLLNGRKSGAPTVVAVESRDRLTPRQLVRHVEHFFAEHPPAPRPR